VRLDHHEPEPGPSKACRRGGAGRSAPRAIQSGSRSARSASAPPGAARAAGRGRTGRRRGAQHPDVERTRAPQDEEVGLRVGQGAQRRHHEVEGWGVAPVNAEPIPAAMRGRLTWTTRNRTRSWGAERWRPGPPPRGAAPVARSGPAPVRRPWPSRGAVNGADHVERALAHVRQDATHVLAQDPMARRLRPPKVSIASTVKAQPGVSAPQTTVRTAATAASRKAGDDRMPPRRLQTRSGLADEDRMASSARVPRPLPAPGRAALAAGRAVEQHLVGLEPAQANSALLTRPARPRWAARPPPAGRGGGRRPRRAGWAGRPAT
jgi:hypothetical protein